MSLANTYFDSSSSPHKYYQVSYKQTARDGSSATYQVSINARLRYSTSYFNYPLYADVTINGTTARVTLNSGSWSGDAWKGAKTVTIKASAGTSGGTLSASIKFTSTSGYSWSITGKTVSLSTWNTAPTWASNDANINGWKQDKIIPENTGSVTIDAPALNDKEQSTMYYDIYRYVNGQQDKTIVRGATKTKGNRYTTTDDISSLGQGAVIKYLIQGHDGVPAWAGDRWTYVYTKNKLTPASASVSGAIGYTTANFVVTLSGALNSDGTTGLKYNLSSPQITIYNATNLTASPTITIFKSGTAPTTPYIRFEDLKSLTINSNWQGSFVINVETVNARGTKASKSVTVSVDLRTNPTSATFKAHGGLVTIGNASYYLPSHKDIVISWNAGSDPLGKAVTYDLQVKKGTGGYETIATGLTATSYTYKTSAVTAKTAFVFKLITRTTFNYTVTKESDVIYAHYYNTPTVSFGTPTRATTEFSIAVTTATRSSMENVAISSRRYKGKSGSWIVFAGSPYTLRETGLTESQAYTITIEITDNSGLTGATQTFTYNVSAYIPILSIRKKGVGVNTLADSTYKFKVGGNANVSGIMNAGNVQVGGNNVYHTGRKPTPADIGASPSSHGHTHINVPDVRNTNPTPNECSDKTISAFFNNQYGDAWRSGITVKGWTDGYCTWQLSNSSSTTLSEDLKFRAGMGTSWNPWRKIYHEGNKPTLSELQAYGFQRLLGDNENLNNYTKTGFYTQGSNAQASNGTNYPRPYAGVLEVHASTDGAMIWQKYHIYGWENNIWIRTYYAGTWNPWRASVYAYDLSHESYVKPTFQNGWKSYGGSYDARFTKDSMRIVHLEGLVTGGTMGKTIFNLPVGYRPKQGFQQAVANNFNGYGQIVIYPGGDVSAYCGSSGWMSLDGISFVADV